MTPLRKRFCEDMQLHGLAARTQESYVMAVKGLAEHYKRSPDLLSDEEIRAFFDHGLSSLRIPPKLTTQSGLMVTSNRSAATPVVFL